MKKEEGGRFKVRERKKLGKWMKVEEREKRRRKV